VLNERCRVFLDLAEILSDSIAETKMSSITWIIIILIIISIGVTVSEVALRFALLEREKGKGKLVVVKPVESVLSSAPEIVSYQNTTGPGKGLSAEQVQALCGIDIIGQTFADMGYC
jgi:hypothetical protein